MHNRPDYLIALGQKITELREERGISQVLLSEMANISRSQLVRLEKGDLNITMKTLFNLANAFEVPAKRAVGFLRVRGVSHSRYYKPLR